ncbi:hypothetical protein HDU76_011054, partial [Blyttiomyces sp. JEL0837]
MRPILARIYDTMQIASRSVPLSANEGQSDLGLSPIPHPVPFPSMNLSARITRSSARIAGRSVHPLPTDKKELDICSSPELLKPHLPIPAPAVVQQSPPS